MGLLRFIFARIPPGKRTMIEFYEASNTIWSMRCFHHFISVIFVFAVAILNAREFTLADGTTLNGTVVSFKNGTIVIAKDGGGKALYTLPSFSEADQDYLMEQFPDGAKREIRPGTATKKPDIKHEPSPKPTTAARRTAPANTQPPHPGLKNLQLGMNAPDVKARAQGKAEWVSLKEDLHGKLVIVHFWSTAVPQSIREVEGLAYLYKKYRGRGFELIGVAMDQSRRRLNDVEGKLGVSWPMRLDEERKTIDEWGVIALPTNVLIDQAGVIRREHISARELQHLLAQQLGE